MIYDGFRELGSGHIYRLGLDFHGVLDTEPGFIRIARHVIDFRGEVHILTGSHDTPQLRKVLLDLGVPYTHLFSMASYHEAQKTKMWYTGPNNPWMDTDVWNRTKANYCTEHQINLHIDDSGIYGQYFTTPYIRFVKELDI